MVANVFHAWNSVMATLECVSPLTCSMPHQRQSYMSTTRDGLISAQQTKNQVLLNLNLAPNFQFEIYFYLFQDHFKSLMEIGPLPEEAICVNCQYMTTGNKCDHCHMGFFGGAANGQQFCQPCDCNGHGNTCDEVSKIDCPLFSHQYQHVPQI